LPFITNLRALLLSIITDDTCLMPKFSASSLLNWPLVTDESSILFNSGFPYSHGHQMRGFLTLS